VHAWIQRKKYAGGIKRKRRWKNTEFLLVSGAGPTFFSLPDGLRHLFREIIIPIPYSIFHTLCDM
jgi:hypothetical protein